MFHPTRGGVRGGKDQFTWESVKTDKDRECYLGHSLMAPVGRWQEGKDIMWYSKEDQKSELKKKANEEFLKAKELEEKALMAALGYKIVDKPKTSNENENNTEKKAIKRHRSKEDNSESEKEKYAKESFDLDLKDKKKTNEILMNLIVEHGIEEIFKALDSDYSAYAQKLIKRKKRIKKEIVEKKSLEADNSSYDEKIKLENKNKEKDAKKHNLKKSKIDETKVKKKVNKASQHHSSSDSKDSAGSSTGSESDSDSN